MAAIYSVKLLEQLGATVDFFYVVPAGYVVVVRDIDVYQGAVLSDNKLFFQGNLGQTITRWEGGLDQDVVANWRGRQVFGAGESFTMHNVGGFAWDYTISGYMLTAP